MTKRLALLAVGIAAAASFATPAAAVYPVCPTHTSLDYCLKYLLSSDSEPICVPTGDLEDDCHWG